MFKSRALQLPPESDETRYFLPNNAAYCFNQLGRHQEAERCCLTAIEIDPKRHNAYKNLGIALQNLGQYAEAARNFIQATKLGREDRRALEHLKALIADHPEVSEGVPDLMELFECSGMVQETEGEYRLQ